MTRHAAELEEGPVAKKSIEIFSEVDDDMWRKTKKVPALKLDTKEETVSVETVRRIEVSVEREVCSLTVHGQLVLKDQQSCPLCGQRLAAGETAASDGPTGIDSEIPNDDRRLK